tara:strand:+ start:11649 stop:15683 length:4035 start_codon:yes stop_codon:yes gene_type:complete
MADKHVEIEILQEALETVTNTTVTQYVANPGFSTALLNSGTQAVTGGQSYIQEDMTANGIPSAGWNGVGFGGGGTAATYFRNTPTPVVSGGQCKFPVTAFGVPSEYVQNWSFGLNLWQSASYGSGSVLPNYLGAAAVWANITPKASMPGYGFWRFDSHCGNAAGTGNPYNPVGALAPTISLVGGGGCCTDYMRLDDAGTDYCTQGGSTASTGIFQTFNLTAGNSYVLEIKLKNADVSMSGALRFGLADLTGGAVINGDMYENLGGDCATMYGTSGLGCSGPGGNCCVGNYYMTGWNTTGAFSPYTTNTQSAVFTSVGGNEVLYFEYFSGNGAGSATPGNIDASPLDFYYISIKDNFSTAPLNSSAIYQSMDMLTPNGLPASGHYTLEFDFWGDPTETAIHIGDNVPTGQMTASSLSDIVDSTGWAFGGNGITFLNPSTNQYFPNVLGTYFDYDSPLSVGTNVLGPIPFTSPNSAGAWSATDRLLCIQVFNNSGATDTYLDNIHVRMQITETYQTIDYDLSTYGKLEVSNSEDFPLSISYNISDGKDLASRFGDYTQSFDIPATKQNNKVLANLWYANAENKQKSYGIKPCRILVDNIPFFNGQMQVKKSAQTDSPKSYSCTIYGGNFSWMSLLKDAQLCHLWEDDGSDDFLFDFPTIEGTWALYQNQTNVQYPLISYGDFWPSQNGGMVDHVNLFDPDPVPDWRPSFYVKNMFDRIFKKIGYTISSNFINSNNFKRLLNHFPFINNTAADETALYSTHKQLKDTDSGGNPQLVSSNGQLITGLLANGWITIKLNQNVGVGDPSNSYSVTTGIWTCPKTGQYSVWGAGGYWIFNWDNDCNNPWTGNQWTPTSCDWYNDGCLTGCTAWIWSTRIKVTPLAGPVSYIGSTANGWGSPSWNPLHWPVQGCDDAADYNTAGGLSGTVMLQQGDQIELQCQFQGQDPMGSCVAKVNVYATYSSGTGGSTQPMLEIVYDNPNPNLGDTVTPNQIMPCDKSQIDYIKSIAHLFNLYFTTDVVSKTVYIEPFNDFFTKEGAVDWTRKVDFGQDIVDDYDIGLKRELKIGYKEDSADIGMESLNFKAGIYGDETKLYNYEEDLGEDYETGVVNMTNPIFASSMQIWDNDAFDNVANALPFFPPLIPAIWNEDAFSGLNIDNTQWRPLVKMDKYLPRIFYYSLESTNGTSTIITNNPNTTVNAGSQAEMWSSKRSNGTVLGQYAFIPRATFIDFDERIHQFTLRPSLSFTDQTFIAPSQFTANTVPGLYRVYYKNMIEQLKKAPRIRTVYIDLKISDILTLDMKKLVYLDGSWWRINKISEYSPAKNIPTKVELIQWIEDIGRPVQNGVTIQYDD